MSETGMPQRRQNCSSRPTRLTDIATKYPVIYGSNVKYAGWANGFPLPLPAFFFINLLNQHVASQHSQAYDGTLVATRTVDY